MNDLTTFDNLVHILGFSDSTNFFITVFFVLVGISAISAFIYAGLKKKKERPVEIEKAVAKIQEEILPVVKEDGLEKALSSTKSGFIAKLSNFFAKTPNISDKDFEEIEAILYTADIGPKTIQKLLDNLKEKIKEFKRADAAFLLDILKEDMYNILTSVSYKPKNNGVAPRVIMFVGVNGAGKTTSIGKLAHKFMKEGQKVLLGAGDTFRAAAVKQLTIWGERVAAQTVFGKENQDSASVLFEAIKKGIETNTDVVLCDTAGRLHTKEGLMDELKKVYKVLGKAKEGAPDEVLLVIDATMGQNAILQAKEFTEATPLCGIVISKLDGTAKGGVILGIVDELKVPIRYIGIGEKIDDLRDFDAKEFIEALFKK